MDLIIIIIFFVIIYMHYAIYIVESFENRMEYAGQDLIYNNNPRDPNFNFTNFLDGSILVQDPAAYTNKSLYSIDY